MKSLLLLLLMLGLSAAGAAEAPKRCGICGRSLGASYYSMASPLFAEKQVACESCAKIKERCATCRLPVLPASDHKLADGRHLCDRDFRVALFDATEIHRVFDEAR